MDELERPNLKRVLIWDHSPLLPGGRGTAPGPEVAGHLAGVDVAREGQTLSRSDTRGAHAWYFALPGLALVVSSFGIEIPSSSESVLLARAALIATGFGMILWPIAVWVGWRRRFAARNLESLLRTQTESGRRLDPRGEAELQRALQSPRLSREECQALCGEAYVNAVQRAVSDALDGEADLALLAQLESHFPLRPESVFVARLQVFWDTYFAAVADHALSDREEARMDHVRRALGVPSARDLDERVEAPVS